MNLLNKSEKFWDKQSAKFDKRTKRYEQNYALIIKNTRKYLKASDIVLDFACGTGTITIEIAEGVKKIKAIDISSKMLELAQRKAEEHKILNIDFLQATIFDSKFVPESFDVVQVFNILHLVNEPHTVMQRIYQLLKPGGLVITATPCLGNKRTFLSLLILLLTKMRLIPFMCLYKTLELEQLITNGNLQIIETESFKHNLLNHFVIARKL